MRFVEFEREEEERGATSCGCDRRSNLALNYNLAAKVRFRHCKSTTIKYCPREDGHKREYTLIASNSAVVG